MGFAHLVASTFFLRLIALGIGIVGSVVLARSLGVEGAGTFSLLISFPNLAVAVMTFGLSSAATYFIAQRPSERAFFVTNLFYFSLVMGAVLAVGWWAIIDLLRRYYFGPELPLAYLYLVIPLLPLIFFNAIAPAVLHGLYRISEANFAEVLSAAVRVALYVALLGVLGYSVGGALVAWIVTMVIAGTYIGVIVARSTKLSGRFSRSHWKESVSYGRRAYVGMVAELGEDLVPILLGAMLPVAQIGLYAVARTVVSVAKMPARAVRLPLFPRIARAQPDEAGPMFARIMRVSIAFSLLASVGVGLGGWLLLPLVYGEEFAPAVPVLMGLLPGIFAGSISDEIRGFFMGAGRPGLRTQVSVVTAVLVVVGVLVGANVGGLVSAVVGISIARVVGLLTGVYLLLKHWPTLRLVDLWQVTREDRNYLRGLLPRF